MTHDDYLYLLEYFTKTGDEESAKKLANEMKTKNDLPESIVKARQRIIDAGFEPYYLV